MVATWPGSPRGRGTTSGSSTSRRASRSETLLSTPYAESGAVFSPDSRWIAYGSNESGRPEVYVRPLPPATGRWQVSNQGGGEPRWSAGGDELFYRSEEGLMAVDISATGDTLRAGTPRLLFSGDFRGSVTGLSVGGFTFRSLRRSAGWAPVRGLPPVVGRVPWQRGDRGDGLVRRAAPDLPSVDRC